MDVDALVGLAYDGEDLNVEDLDELDEEDELEDRENDESHKAGVCVCPPCIFFSSFSYESVLPIKSYFFTCLCVKLTSSDSLNPLMRYLL